MFCRDLFETVRAHLLYHALPIDRLYEVLEDDELRPNTAHPITHTGGPLRGANHWGFRPSDVSANGYLRGVSLTRNLTFARAWKSAGAVLVLNGDLIRRDRRIIPISFFGGRREIAHEAEEFVIGAIKPLSRYLIHYEVSQETLERNRLVGDLENLVATKPKMVVTGHGWRATGLDKGSVIKKLASVGGA